MFLQATPKNIIKFMNKSFKNINFFILARDVGNMYLYIYILQGKKKIIIYFILQGTYYICFALNGRPFGVCTIPDN